MGYTFGHLKSGTDVRGIAVGENITLTDEAVCAISRAFVKWLSLKSGKTNFKIAVGNDSTLTYTGIQTPSVAMSGISISGK